MTGLHRPPRRGMPARRGSAYLLVLMSAMLVALIGLTTLAVERVRVRAATADNDWMQAQTLASSAVEHALHVVRQASTADLNWRQIMRDAGDDVFAPIPLAGGTIGWSLQQGSGSRMSDDPDKLVYVVGTGEKGQARHRLRTIIRAAGPAYNCLTVPIHSNNDILFDAGTVLQCDGAISANDDIEAISSSIFCPTVRAHDQIVGSTYFGVTLPAVPLLAMPSADAVRNYWNVQGVLIDANLLPLSGGERVLENLVLSPNENPFGATDPEGVYVIDCHDDLLIRNVRVLGTLVIEFHGAESDRATIAGSVLITPATASHPAIICEKNLHLAMTTTDLSESATGVNYNPLGTAYLGGDDDTLDDLYPSILQGLMYATGDIRIEAGYSRVDGVLLANHDIRSDPSAILEVTYRPSIAEDPPTKFFIPDGQVRIAPFSWARVED